VVCVLCLWVLLMRWLYASEAPVSMRQPDTDTVYTTPGMQELYGQCFVCGLCVVCVCVSSMCVRSGRPVYVWERSLRAGRPRKTSHTQPRPLIGHTLRKKVNNTHFCELMRRTPSQSRTHALDYSHKSRPIRAPCDPIVDAV
jgi:hypothetical protein